MKRKSLWRISVTTTLEAEEAVIELLGATLGQFASSHCNVETQTNVVSIFGSQKIILADKARERLSVGLKRIKNCGLNIGSGKIKIAKVRREDWAESWKRHFKAIEIGKALLIKPSWIKRKPRKNQTVVILDPGLSFGTGQHATTSFCLHQIVSAGCSFGAARPTIKPQARHHSVVLGYRHGFGNFAIAAVKLGYKPVHAFDFDPEAVRVAHANARVNQVVGKLKIGSGDVTKLPLQPTRKFDLVCANLISNLLIAERRRIVAQLNPGGTLVLAGILKSEFGQVQKSYEDLELKLTAARSEKGEWRSGAFQFSAK